MTDEQKFDARQLRARAARTRQIPNVIAENMEQGARLVGDLAAVATAPVRRAAGMVARHIPPVATGVAIAVVGVACADAYGRHVVARQAREDRQREAMAVNVNPGETFEVRLERRRAEAAERAVALQVRVEREQAQFAKRRKREVAEFAKKRKREAAQLAERRAIQDREVAESAKRRQREVAVQKRLDAVTSPKQPIRRKPARSRHGRS